ncbi:MAG TPA: hypothetical protein DF610_04740, partial [Sphingobacterium sp.]|nr:hypothetical protein [Sphingobacterium sp.]
EAFFVSNGMRTEALGWVRPFSLRTFVWGMWVAINPSGITRKLHRNVRLFLYPIYTNYSNLYKR